MVGANRIQQSPATNCLRHRSNATRAMMIALRVATGTSRVQLMRVVGGTREVGGKVFESATAIGQVSQTRTFASEADPKDYGYLPDPIEHSTGLEKKMMLARLAGDDRYEPKVFYRAEHATREKPNLVPAYYEDAIIGCLCEPDSQHVNYMMIRMGTPRRCECGHWFKLIQTGPDFF